MKCKDRRWAPLAIGLLVAFAATAVPGFAAEPEDARADAGPADNSQPAEPATADAPAGVAAAGMLAFRDPVTGELRPPTEAELAAIRPQLEALFNQSSEGLEQIELPDGSVGVDLQGRFATAVVATVGPDGTVTTRCVNRAEGLLEPETNADDAMPAADTGGSQTPAAK